MGLLMQQQGGGLLNRSAPQNSPTNVDSFLASLARKESSGRYDALGPVINNRGMYQGDRAYGKYQVMGKNVPVWTKQYLGVAMTPQQFLRDQKAQDLLMRARASELYQKYGNWEDVASVHFSGQPLSRAGNAKDQLGTTTPDYVRAVTGNPGLASQIQADQMASKQANSFFGLLKETRNQIQSRLNPTRAHVEEQIAMEARKAGKVLPPEELQRMADERDESLGYMKLPGSSDDKNATRLSAFDIGFGVASLARKTFFNTIAKLRDPGDILNILKKEVPNLSDDTAKALSKTLTTIDDPQKVNEIVTQAINQGPAGSGKGLLGRTQAEPTKAGLLSTDQSTPRRATNLPPSTEAPKRTRAEVEYKGKALASDPVYQKTGVPSTAIKEAEDLLTGGKATRISRFSDTMRKFTTPFKEKVVNDWQRVKELGETPGLKLSGELTPYERRKLMSGRQTARLQETQDTVKKIDKDILNTSKKIKAPELKEDVFDYLKARHAPERNAKLGDGAAGMTNKEAQELMAKIDASPRAVEVKRIADDLQKFHNETLDILYAEGKPWGVIDKELYDTLRKTYKNHIPLNRVLETDDISEVLSGRSLDVKGSGLQAAKGSDKEVKDIIENIYSARAQAIQRVEKNIVDNETYNFVVDYIKSFPGQELFSIVKAPAIGKTFDGKIITQQINDPTILQLQRNGKPAYIKINDPRLAVALKGVNREQLPALLRHISTVTRWMSALVTRYSPEFALSNKLRDIQEAIVYMAAQKETGFKGAVKTFGRDPASINDIKNFLLGKNTAGTRLYGQMIEDGGTTGGMALSTRKQAEKTLEAIRKSNRSNTRKTFETIAEGIDNWNRVFEDSTRLSAYKTALDSGLTRDQAAVIAKNVSIDFNEFGTWGPVINSMYMFANASIQGSAKMLRAMKDPKVATAVVGTMGASVYAANSWNDEVDPEWRGKVTKWDKLNGLNIVIPGTDEFYYVSIPVSWGLKPIKVAMEYGNDLVAGRETDVGEAAGGIFTALIEGYNPVGGTDLASAVTPSISDPFIAISRNKSWSGGMLRPDWNKYAPKSTQYFPDLKESKTGDLLIDATKATSDKTGGRIEVSPADAEYILQQLTGGPGRLAGKVFNSISAINEGEVPEVRDMPFISRILRNTPEDRFMPTDKEEDLTETLTEQERERFYAKQEAEEVFEEMKAMPSEQRKAEYLRLKKEDPALLKKVDAVADKEEKGLTRLERQISDLGVDNGARAKYLYKVFQEATREEKVSLYKDYVKKGLISKEVREQLDYLFAHPELMK